MAATIKAVAKMAGISVVTVSRVTNNCGIVSDELKGKVLKSIKELGYRPNAVAKSLKNEKIYTIGLLMLYQIIQGVNIMEYFSDQNFGRVFTLRLDQGDYVLESIKEFIKKEEIENGVVLSAIGTLDYCTLHMVMTTGYPPVEHFEHWEDTPLELSSIDGFIANGEPHLHTVVSDHEKAYSGHLEEKCRVLYLAEIVIAEIKTKNLTRKPDEKNILKLQQA